MLFTVRPAEPPVCIHYETLPNQLYVLRYETLPNHLYVLRYETLPFVVFLKENLDL